MKLNLNKFIKNKYFPFFILFILMIFIHRFMHFVIVDDNNFYYLSQTNSLFCFIKQRYMTWSARVSVETVIYFLFKFKYYLWQILNPIMITLLAFLISKLTLDNNLDNKKEYKYNILCCCLIGLMNFKVISSGMAWATGSINYLWTIVSALAALIPFKFAIIGKKISSKLLCILFIICTIFTSFGQEQVCVALLFSILLADIFIIIKYRKLNISLIIQTILCIIGFLVLLLAPGNSVRYAYEIESRYRYFGELNIIQHLFLGVQWFLKFIINESKVLLITLLGVLSWLLYNKPYKPKLKILTFIPILGITLLVISMFYFNQIPIAKFHYDIETIFRDSFFNFNQVGFVDFDIKTTNILQLTPFIVWGSIIISIPILFFFIDEKFYKKISYLFTFFMRNFSFSSNVFFTYNN